MRELVTRMYKSLSGAAPKGIVVPNSVNNCMGMSCLHGCRKQWSKQILNLYCAKSILQKKRCVI